MTTKIAVITDVHANLPALEAALHAIKQEGYDRLMHTGDTIDLGPFPTETLDTLLSTPNITFIMGNHDAYFAQNKLDPALPDWFSPHMQWTWGKLDDKLRPVLAQWPYLLQEEIEGVRLSFLHYALDASGQDFVAPVESTPASLDQLFASYDSDLLFYGHDHPFSDVQGHARYINPGTLGFFSQPVARYTIILLDKGHATIEHRSVPYDQERFLQAYEQRQVAGREILRKAVLEGTI